VLKCGIMGFEHWRRPFLGACHRALVCLVRRAANRYLGLVGDRAVGALTAFAFSAVDLRVVAWVDGLGGFPGRRSDDIASSTDRHGAHLARSYHLINPSACYAEGLGEGPD
jgi:hypothetical protein